MPHTRIIVAGQSNALGYLNTDPAPYLPTKRVQIWCDTDGDGVADNWNYMLPGHNTGTPNNPTVWGPEVQFANRWLASQTSGYLWIVKVAKGSTGLAEDASLLDWSPDSSGEMYDAAKTAVTDAHNNLGGGPYAFDTYDGLLWMQGEEDATSEAKANAYLANLQAFVAAVRADWLVNRVVIGRITDSAALAYSLAVRVAQWQMWMDDPEAPSFKTIGFDMQPDTIHYSPRGHVQLGRAFYDAWVGP